MENCCSNNLGRFPHNKQIDTAIMVSDLGDYILRFRGSDNSTFELIKTIEEPGTLNVEIGELNENMTYTFTVEKPDTTLISLNECETFKLTTIINTQLDGCSNPCDNTDDSEIYA